ncbi:hypothetical protein ACA910_002999 [Epithemia clementina (nom. ined.)]
MTEADRNHANLNGPHIYRFVFTGGPCGGKTTALARVFSYLRERGFEVITCPEAYTLLSSNGMSAHLFSTEGMPLYIQSAVFDTQMTLENSVWSVLKARGKPGVILCDRGSMDNTVYLDAKTYEKRILQPRGTDIVQVRDNRYDAVLHLVTAADGALPHYTLENNLVRSETPEQAIQVDRRTQQAWVGHPHLYVFDNSTDFEGKMNRLVNVISKIVGLPSNLKRRSAKFLLEPFPLEDVTKMFPADIPFEMFDVEKVYLQRIDEDENASDPNYKKNYSFVRKRSLVDRGSGTIVDSVYQSTTVTHTSEGEVIEQKRIITHREYVTALMSRDTSRHIVRQRRISFLYKLQSFAIHYYQQPVPGLCILHAQVEVKGNHKENQNGNNNTNNGNGGAENNAGEEQVADINSENDGSAKVILPPFLKAVRQLEDTPKDEAEYGAYSLSVM